MGLVAVLPILTGADNPLLRRKTKKVDRVTKEVKRLLRDMHATALGADGLGLAAPQVGSDLRVCIALLHGKLTPLIDPAIVWKSAETDTQEEGCLSLPGVTVMVPRAVAITLRYADEKGAKQERRFSGWDARVAQHEVDHLDGVLIVDYRIP